MNWSLSTMAGAISHGGQTSLFSFVYYLMQRRESVCDKTGDTKDLFFFTYSPMTWPKPIDSGRGC